MEPRIKKFFLVLGLLFSSLGAALRADDTLRDELSVAGLYKAVLYHDGKKFYQLANLTLRTVNNPTGLRVSATVQMLFGDWTSTEFLTYEYDEVPLNILTGQFSIENRDKNNVYFIGFRKNDSTLEGEWYSTINGGKVGKFIAIKEKEPTVPGDGILVRSLTGHYRGTLKNIHPESRLPERVTISLVATQDVANPTAPPRISGNTRFYLGEFGSLEYIELKLTDVQFNFYRRFLTAKTDLYGLTFRGYVSHDGQFLGDVFADGLGEVAKVDIKRL